MRLALRAIVGGAALSLLAAAMTAPPAQAGEGALATDWASSGVLALPWSFAPVHNTTRIASSPGGNLFLAGDDGAKGCVTRLTSDGVLDPTFNDAPDLVGSVCDLAAGANGRVVALQPTTTGGAVAALGLADSRLVARFDALGGYMLSELPGSYAGDGGQILDVTPMADGRTALLETRDATGAAWVTIIEESGSFVGDWVVPDIDPSHAFQAHQILPGPSSSLILVGELDQDSGDITAALRTDADGNPDPAFSGDGFSAGPPSLASHVGRGALAPDGRIVLAAVSGTDVHVRRLTTAGDLDSTFRTSGSSATLPAATDGVGDVVTSLDGRVYLAFDGDATSTAISVARLTGAGALDTTFDGDGYAAYDAGSGHLRGATSAARAPHGDLYVFAASSVDEPEVVRFEGTSPAPVAAMSRPTSVWTLSSSVPLAWGATSAIPVTAYDVRTRRASYDGVAPATSTPLVSGTTTRSRTVTGVPGGTTLCASTRAQDLWTQWSDWSDQRCTSVPLTPSQLTRGKGFTSKAKAGTYAGRVLSATKKGSLITRSGVKAKRLALVATTCPSCGKAKVYLGSDLLATVSLKSSTTRTKVVISIATFTTTRSGTVKVKVASKGKKVLVEGIGVSKV